MQPILIELGPLKLYSFGVFIAISAVASGLFAYWAASKRRLSTDHWFDTIIYSIVGGLVGGRLVFYFLYSKEFSSFWQLLYIWQGGLVLLGSLVVGFLVLLRMIKKTKEPIWQMLDVSALALLLGWAVGKFGCHLSGCSVGRSADTLFTINNAFPVDAFSSIWALAVFIVMLFAWLRNKLSDGVVFFLSMEALFLGDLLIKTLRLDFGEGVTRIEAIIYLGLIVTIYLLFWKFHGPRFQKEGFGTKVRNFVFRRHLR